MKITIQATISADKKKVWDYYTDPKHIINWNFASDDWCCPNAENDLQVGGKYKARMEAKDGSFGFDFEGIYSKIDIGESFTFIMEDGRSVNIFIEKIGDTCKMIVTFDAEEENSEEIQRNGWQSILNNFKNYVENN